jgi:predicted SnoaL-like aldol condensation-catalyzing enzyme
MGRVREAYDSFVAPHFRHHNPYFAGDAKSLAAGMEAAHRTRPNAAIEIQRTIEEGDLVAVHSRVRRSSGEEIAVVHVFRFEDDKVAELWDIGAPVPTDSPNQYGMF